MSGTTITLSGALGGTSATLAIDVLEIGTAPFAGAGMIRMPNNVTVAAARNAADSADIDLVVVDGSNNVTLGDGTDAAAVSIASAGTTTIKTGATAKLTVATGLLTSASPVAIGATVAAAGSIRLPTTVTALAARNAGNSADVALVAIDASDNVTFGDGTNGGTNLNVNSKTSLNLQIAGTTSVAVAASGAVTLGANTANLAFGTKPASAGILRMNKVALAGTLIVLASRNNADTADLKFLSADSSDDIILGDSAQCLGMYIDAKTGGSINLRTNAVARAVFDDATFTLKSGTTTRIAGDATGIGVFAVAPVARAAALTQTYATATRTHSNPTAAAVATTAAGLASYGFTQAQADSLPVAINALVVDVANIKQFVNALVDDLQAYGWEQ